MAAQSALVRFQASSALSPNDMARPFNDQFLRVGFVLPTCNLSLLYSQLQLLVGFTGEFANKHAYRLEYS